MLKSNTSRSIFVPSSRKSAFLELQKWRNFFLEIQAKNQFAIEIRHFDFRQIDRIPPRQLVGSHRETNQTLF
jgi:hypothetical protein